MRKGLLSFCFEIAALTATGQTISHQLHKSPHQPKPPVINARESQETCTYTGLSKSLLFRTRLEPLQILTGKRQYDSCQIKITVLNKLSHKVIFTTEFLSGFLYNAYSQCNAVRSYTTGAGQDAAIKDYDYGDLVVADFNFDGKEDFAAKNGSGGNRGPTYTYYIQNSAGLFKPDNFLTERMGYFPARMHKASKTLLLESAKAGYSFKSSYRLNPKTHKWRETIYEAVRLQ